ncbi:[LSU ribosomal protein L11P]-lysine N-methyltransferase [Natranaerovirga hydrolytica]|uniref:Ribosomal protein L11 methyltransferase n=1 Tax=Natranaerovirga hydrolytica TaxID=680378 RepID=A0A4R1MYL7_9FIRM|nr:50S ribosomal protein L11 methyltransferase [Natranaerovirga hydrolytica]TCK98398.1 [LSU ribosomal protein L11P]-lysine N-methyltransferase [Natranaerovirga hydrolytica]
MKWIQYKLKTTSEAVDIISYKLYEIGIQGIEVEDNVPLSEQDKEKMFVDILEEQNTNDNSACIKFYVSEEDNKDMIKEVTTILEQISEFMPVGSKALEKIITDEKDWAENWKKYFKPFKVEEHIIVKPTWETLKNNEKDDIIIEIDPGMAFGTGTHETTSLCVSGIKKYLNSKDSVYDIGCGSGILGIVASKLGAREVICTDIDPVAVTVAKENVKVNKVANNVSVYQGNLLENIDKKANIVVANILADVIIHLTQDINKVLAENGYFISSGIILDKVKDVTVAIEKQGLQIIEINKKGEWASIIAKN